MSRSISRRNEFHIGQLTGLTLPTTTVDANSTNAAQDTQTIPKAGVNDVVLITVQTPTSGIIYDGYVSAASTITVRAHNITTGNLTPTASTYQIQVLKR